MNAINKITNLQYELIVENETVAYGTLHEMTDLAFHDYFFDDVKGAIEEFSADPNVTIARFGSARRSYLYSE